MFELRVDETVEPISVFVFREITRIEIIFETFDHSPFNHLMPLLGGGASAEFCRRGNFRSNNHDWFSYSSVRKVSLGSNMDKLLLSGIVLMLTDFPSRL
jgi:hypothetical protein